MVPTGRPAARQPAPRDDLGIADAVARHGGGHGGDGARGAGAAHQRGVRGRRRPPRPPPGARAGAPRRRGAGPRRRRLPRQDRHADRGRASGCRRSCRARRRRGRGPGRAGRARRRRAAPNATCAAHRARRARRRAGWERAEPRRPFSSARKWSAATFGDGTAPGCSAPRTSAAPHRRPGGPRARRRPARRQGRRVLLLARPRQQPSTATTLPAEPGRPPRWSLLEEQVRADAADTLALLRRAGRRP